MKEDLEQLEQQDDGLSKVLKKLKRKENHLKQLIAEESGADEREILQRELNVVHSQRRRA